MRRRQALPAAAGFLVVILGLLWPLLPRFASLDGLCLVRRFDDAFLNLGRTYAFALVEPGTPCPPSP
jgi:hypothetical protein